MPGTVLGVGIQYSTDQGQSNSSYCHGVAFAGTSYLVWEAELFKVCSLSDPDPAYG